ncbi:uncharacterized protein LOC111268278 [Varroa jacobsoni]|uniref:Uncharacterized protein n=1 Tax=Varroa destructor TaxID=109461 RepID=A0A7M7JZK8_VARDE|nr:uncharacterized protein LOC111247903 [Varroa destructor]XP_022702907.1 uncharacterized protein LOC111268278 [Varroa jacobsoni]
MCYLFQIIWLMVNVLLLQLVDVSVLFAQRLAPEDHQVLQMVHLSKIISVQSRYFASDQRQSDSRRVVIVLVPPGGEKLRVQRRLSTESFLVVGPSPNLPNGLDVPPPVRKTW